MAGRVEKKALTDTTAPPPEQEFTLDYFHAHGDVCRHRIPVGIILYRLAVKRTVTIASSANRARAVYRIALFKLSEARNLWYKFGE
ncbi:MULTISPECIES: hypothetical protein [unclassified Endozoicomonas]|uniref:hypothetical protein n=1 Tax=unclassified Endozoicomonas TaxID=2644528 RepID=UPI0021497AAA|nr:MULTISPECIES: hypothetical protein [unclassified Endozoicomonas]